VVSEQRLQTVHVSITVVTGVGGRWRWWKELARHHHLYSRYSLRLCSRRRRYRHRLTKFANSPFFFMPRLHLMHVARIQVVSICIPCRRLYILCRRQNCRHGYMYPLVSASRTLLRRIQVDTRMDTTCIRATCIRCKHGIRFCIAFSLVRNILAMLFRRLQAPCLHKKCD